jgi:hypothetical protein
MSGVSLANSRRAFKHILKYVLVAVILSILSLPYNFLAYYIFLFAFLHSSVNHGAKVFPHLFGFLGMVVLIYFTTPALTASYNKKRSTAAARSSLLRVVSYTRS